MSAAAVNNILLSLAALLVLVAIRVVVLWVVKRRARDVHARYRWRKGSAYTIAVLGVVILASVWSGSFGSVATFLGLVSAGVAIAMKDPLVNMAGWVFLLWKRPFGPGDRVTIQTYTGDVIDQRIFEFAILEVGTGTGTQQSTGRIVHIPNGWIFRDAVVNHTRAFSYIWNEIAVTVPFDSNWRRAREILEGVAHEHVEQLSPDAQRTLREAAQEYLIFYSKLTPVVYTSVVDSGVRLTLRYLVKPRRARPSEQTIWEALLDAFEATEDVEFAYPTSRVFRMDEEGKGAGKREEGQS